MNNCSENIDYRWKVRAYGIYARVGDECECVNTVQSTFHAVIFLFYTYWDFQLQKFSFFPHRTPLQFLNFWHFVGIRKSLKLNIYVGGLSSSSEVNPLAVETEVGDWLTVFIVMLKCPPWNTAPLNGPVPGIAGVFVNDNVSASLSIATDVRGAFAAASVHVEFELNISDIFLCFC